MSAQSKKALAAEASAKEEPAKKKDAAELVAPPGIQLRHGKKKESIGISFYFEGQEYRETVKIPITSNNLTYVIKRRDEILRDIAKGTFVYEEYFPNSLKSKAAAKEREAEEAKNVIVTVGHVLSDYLMIAKRNLELSSFNQYTAVSKCHLFPQWRDTPLKELTSKELRLWIMKFNSNIKTVSSIILPMRNAIDQAIKDGIIDANPFDTIKLGKILDREQTESEYVVDPFDVDEIEKILKACEQPQERNMFQFAFGSGMRPSEYIALDWKDVAMKNGTVRVTSSFVDGAKKGRGKTKKSVRKIDLRNLAADALAAQYAITGAISGLVFQHPINQGQWTGDKQVRDRWKRILKLADVQYRNPYQTRHTYASSLLMLDTNKLYLVAQMGHTDPTMIDRVYAKWIDEGITGDKRARLEAMYADFTQKSKN